ncbi:hypothetical protein Poli38472_003129 [Pythium oligandrum]|uniref:Uncharacterized protein n=1 Tax=Pythium oligandrum TaxID=41045 RepID=A0A8K1C5Z1_PYTOL|nr:hypothetical protein Poli38472_003129 [Pythium oligandrum]|eukprot:TMW57204.1 hypothetical protein Poli38472_003129 [Pythium oligandrum]
MEKTTNAKNAVAKSKPRQDSGYVVQLVMREPDAPYRLRQSRRHGMLHVNTTTQEVSIRYPKTGPCLFQRRVMQPRKCIMGRQVMKLFPCQASSAFMSRLVSAHDVPKCRDALRLIGVGVIDATLESYCIKKPEAAVVQARHGNIYEGPMQELSATLSDPQRAADISAWLTEYSQSQQLEADIASISSALFS